MEAFPASFLLLFLQVAVGGLFALAATPFHELSRGFYKSTGGVLFVVGVLGLLGKADLYRKAASPAPGATMEVFLYAAFIVCFALYLYSLWSERVVLRARLFTLSLFTGLAALAAGAREFYHAPFPSVEALVYPASFVVSALLLGGVTVGMLIGHWYLIDTGQTIEPFVRIFKFFFFALMTQTLFFVVLPLLLYFFGTSETVGRLSDMWQSHQILLTARVLTTQVGSLVLSFMIWRTLKIPHTMAATGLFYIAMLGVFVGELLGRQILALTSLPF
ncbi:MAG TPA: hypothetical protein VGH50_06550 [Candidatus Binatia bacterium]|jgi:hypothetical protein